MTQQATAVPPSADVPPDDDVFSPDDVVQLAETVPAELALRNFSGDVAQAIHGRAITAEMSNGLYHSQTDYISHSGMIQLLRSPAHYKAYLDKRTGDDAEKFNLGTAIHCRVLEPHLFDKQYALFEGRRAGKPYEEFLAQNPGKIVMNPTEAEKVEGMYQSIRDYSEIPLWDMLQKASKEVSIFWTDPATGVRCRVRLDAVLDDGPIFDLKSFADVRPRPFLKQVGYMEYDLQAAMYQRGYQAFSGRLAPFVFVAVEDAPPYGVWLHTAGQTVIDNGMIKFRRGVRAFKQLQDTQQWDSYTNACSVLELPKYLMVSQDVDDEDDSNS